MTKTTDLPSMHTNHSSVFSNEIAARLVGFEGALVSIETEMEGMKKAYHDERARIDREYELAMQDRIVLKSDIQRARAMALAAQEAFEGKTTSRDNPPSSVDAEGSASSVDHPALTPEHAIANHPEQNSSETDSAENPDIAAGDNRQRLAGG